MCSQDLMTVASVCLWVKFSFEQRWIPNFDLIRPGIRLRFDFCAGGVSLLDSSMENFEDVIFLYEILTLCYFWCCSILWGILFIVVTCNSYNHLYRLFLAYGQPRNLSGSIRIFVMCESIFGPPLTSLITFYSGMMLVCLCLSEGLSQDPLRNT